MTPSIKNRITLAIGSWFVFSTAMGINRKFVSRKDRPPLALGLTRLGPMAAFVVLHRKSNEFRKFCRSIDLRVLTLAHFWRILGADFLVQRSKGRLPGGFAFPAAIGDILAAVGA